MPSPLHDHLTALANTLRWHSLEQTSLAGSGHLTSSLSAADLMAGLVFSGNFRFDVDTPDHPNNDRLIFSKGHASPLFYAIWAVAGGISDVELKTYRELGSRLEGHPTRRFPYAEAATGSLGQGLGIGVGMALNARRFDRLPYRTYVLLGDSEMSEGSQWEAVQLAAHLGLDNLVGILDVNRLGQAGPTQFGHDVDAYVKRLEAFGWKTIAIDGHNMSEITAAFEEANRHRGQPVMVVARTIKGKGISFLEDADGWHGKALDGERTDDARRELGGQPSAEHGRILHPENLRPTVRPVLSPEPFAYDHGDKVATRAAFGHALRRLGHARPDVVAIDGEVGNSTKADDLEEIKPEQFVQLFIAEQTMASTALGLSLRGKRPFVCTFAAFLTRAFDQIRMSQYSDANIVFVGSHAGVAIGEDGPSQMGLEDIAMFRSLRESVVLHPCDAVSTERLTELLASQDGISYLRTLRQSTPVIYPDDETFTIGGSKTLRQSSADVATIVAAGTTLFAALQAADELEDEGMPVRVIDLYSIKPIDTEALRRAARDTGHLFTVEDHYAAGGLGEAVLAALADDPVPVEVMAVERRPISGDSAGLLERSGINAAAIVERVRQRTIQHVSMA